MIWLLSVFFEEAINPGGERFAVRDSARGAAAKRGVGEPIILR